MHLGEVDICSILSNAVASILIHAETLSKALARGCWLHNQELGHNFKDNHKNITSITII